jgi:hypothetical protein
VSLLAAVASSLQNGHAFDACVEQGVLDCVQLRRLENHFNFEHKEIASFDSVTGGRAAWRFRHRILMNPGEKEDRDQEFRS